eukprot:TRINITY_DN1020_c0_g1_i1.p1 TRINITY_DN1020_c0_g1~~TRINITY_DN1020_c0_g1_i1.p1  ORF type:complete len:247 (-),score=64.44 TRINITY_DN1020_c0_g1_i1:104-844(-)
MEPHAPPQEDSKKFISWIPSLASIKEPVWKGFRATKSKTIETWDSTSDLREKTVDGIFYGADITKRYTYSALDSTSGLRDITKRSTLAVKNFVFEAVKDGANWAKDQGFNAAQKTKETSIETYKTVARLGNTAIQSPDFQKLMAITATSTILPKVTLYALGFAQVGVTEGTFAGMWMSSIGTVKGGSLFSVLQSAGTASYVVAPQIVIPGAIGLGVGLLLKNRMTKKDVEQNEEIKNEPLEDDTEI